MRPRSTTTDGFVTKRHAARATIPEDVTIPQQFLKENSDSITTTRPFAQTQPAALAVDQLVAPAPKRPKRRFHLPKTWKMRIILLLVVIFVAIGGFLAVKSFIISGKLFNGGSLLSLLTPGEPLKVDSQGRTNIIIFGTSQDDSAHQNEVGGGGLWLTDSIQLMSIDQKAKTVKMVAIPRDLWVKLDSCEVGDYSKINAVYECGSGLYNSSQNVTGDYKALDAAGAKALMARVQTVTGIQSQYFVHVNYSVLKQSVDAVGGIDVNIVGDGASGVYDTNFDWDCSGGARTCKNVYYPHDGVYHLSGQQALYLARARGDYGAYSYLDFGLDRGDFDRQANQQKIIVALKSKAQSAGVLANPIALSKLLDALGNNVTMSFSAGEIKTLLDFSTKLPSSGLQSVSLVGDKNPVVATDMVAGQSVVVPTSGTYDYSSIINYLAHELSTNPATKENAAIGVYNASSVSGQAGKLQTKLQQLGLAVDTAGNAASSDAGSGHYTLYDQSNGKMPQTLQLLQKTLGVTATTAAVPSDVTLPDDFVVLINR
jgi:LCP family protein required for cell wall assembly